MADGIFISPFATPRVAQPRNPSGSELKDAISAVGGEVIFDVATHAALLPTTDRVDFYDTWELWGPDGPVLDTPARQLQHVERVFERQSALGVPLLAPTVTVTSLDDSSSQIAIGVATVAAGLAKHSWQTLVGTRAFWRSDYRLDEYVGRLAALRSPTWVVTVANEMVMNHEPDLADVEAFSGLLRTIHSLSERSRVILTNADFAGLLGVAAGADTIGTGWDRSMRTFDPQAFHVSSDAGPRIPASYVTQGALSAVLRRDTADAIERWNPTVAQAVRGGPMPPSEQAEREHHMRALRETALSVAAIRDRVDRIARLREHYEAAGRNFDLLIANVQPFVKASDKATWQAQQLTTLESYAVAEGLWRI
ncbi:hypothetical protein [Leifsonia virtsii]|uniref:Uncharacterized protein n=1 Tax=Leifsonia virtsii TaxID=3035915 RepID=A0ABT8IYZ9_9MICO|nr:hypothetical protein [Leifsonia virtsii]MDN4598043.1 hypothetical protein [Leifsonia virtsii]